MSPDSLPAAPSRRRFLAALPAAVSVGAGCLSVPSPPGSTGSRTDDSSTDGRGDRRTDEAARTPSCEVGYRPGAASGPQYPSLPATLSRALAVDFATGFEEAYRRNAVRVAHPGATFLRVETATTADPDPAGAGYLLALRVDVAYGHRSHTSTATATGTSYREETTATVSYLVGEDRVARAETDAADPVDPRRAPGGTVVACS